MLTRMSVPDQQQLQAAMAALEGQRALLGDTVVDAALGSLRARLAAVAVPTDADAGQTLKQVSILFLDVVGSTTLSERLDPEEIHAVMDGALARGTTLVEAHRGRVLQYAGDNLLAVFGADEAHEDDAELAVHCALALLELGRTLGQEVRAAYGHAGFNVRVGIHTGTVLLGGGVDGAGTVRGIAVNVAARMEQTAPAGGLRISHDTFCQVRGAFDVAPQPPLEVKGMSQPVVTYLVERAKPRAFRLQNRGVEGLETPMVGREDELRQLQRAFLSMHASGDLPAQLAAVTVAADAGIGKSRLLDEFRNWAEARPEAFLAVSGRAQPHWRTHPYGLLRDMLAGRLQISDSDSAVLAREKLIDGVAPLFDVDGESQAHVLAHLIGLDFSSSPHVRGILQDATQIRARGFHAAAQWLRRMSERASLPVVLMLDDLHWADDGSLDFIEHLFRANRDMPLFVLELTRPELFERRPQWARAAQAHQRIDLQPLNNSDSNELASALLRRVEDAPILREIITGGAEGNPFYMEELLRMLIDEGAILADRPLWRVVSDRLLSTKVPTTLTGVLQARLDSLLERDRRLVQQASVIGVVFWDQALHALRVDVPTREKLLAVAPETTEALESTQQRGLIHERQPSGFAGTHEFGFKHQILQQVTYDTVLKRQRRSYHARAAAWLTGLTGDRAPERLGAAAEHYARAGDNANACRSFVRAAEWAASRGANTAMLTYVQRALALAPVDDHAMRWRLLSVRERFLVTHGDHTAHAADLDSMQQLAEALDDDALRADVIWRRAFALEDSGDFAAAALLAQRSLELALAAGATPIATKAYAGLGYDLMRLGRLQEAQQAVDRGLALARASGDRMLEPHFLTDAGGIARAVGDPVMALAHFQEALQITRELGNPGNEAMMLNNLADGEMRLGDYAAARGHLQASLEVARSTGNRTSESLALQNLAAVAHQQGLNAEAMAMAQAALEIEVAVGLRHSAGVSLLQLGHARLELGQHEAAQADYERARSLFEAVGRQAMTMEAVAGLARVAMARGDIAQARTCVQQLLEYGDGGGSFDGTEEPLRIALTCWEVMSASNDARATGLLENAHAVLQSQAAQIGDPRLRESFLDAVPHHRAIEWAWAAASASRSTNRILS